jgi:hypothetical protein
MARLLKRRPSFHPKTLWVPSNGEPESLSEIVDDEARAIRDRGDLVGVSIAKHLEKLAGLIRWSGAKTP